MCCSNLHLSKTTTSSRKGIHKVASYIAYIHSWRLHGQSCFEDSVLVFSMIGKVKNPFQVLGVSSNSSLETVKKAFTRLALQYHPDTAASHANNNNNTNNGNISQGKYSIENPSISASEQFVYIRQAYELIRDGIYVDQGAGNDHHKTPPPGPLHRNMHNDRGGYTEKEFLQYFYQQTGLKLTSTQRRELLHLHRSRIPGGRYDGQSWDIARRLAAEQEIFLQRRSIRHEDPIENDGGSSGDGIHSDDDDDKNLRRKRRR
jgi:curved DNA-binding protein CbpA